MTVRIGQTMMVAGSQRWLDLDIAAPDPVHLLPVPIGDLQVTGSADTLRDHALALPGAEPPMSATVEEVSHHLHC